MVNQNDFVFDSSPHGVTINYYITNVTDNYDYEIVLLQASQNMRQLTNILAIALVAVTGSTMQPGKAIAPGLRAVDEYTIIGPKNFLSDYSPKNSDGTINVVVEIPTGTIAKWEVTKPEGKLEWEFKEGKPRIVKYLGYPGNYGMIPRSILPKELGGDGDRPLLKLKFASVQLITKEQAKQRSKRSEIEKRRSRCSIPPWKPSM